MTLAAAALSRRARAPGEARSLFLVLWLFGGALLAFILLPLLRLAASQTLGSLAHVAAMAEVRRAITLSLEAALITALLAALFGVPLAYLLARARFRGRALVAAVIDLPLAVPHTVAGIALLFVLGRQGILGAPLGALLGLRFWGTLAGIVAAMLFVSIPYTVNAARIGFEAVDPRLEMTARTLGLGPWQVLRHVSLPLAWRSIMTGLTLTYARAISEFGAVVILVYHPMTAPVKIYELFLRFGLDEAAGMAVLLLLLSLALFILLRALAFGRTAPPGHGR
ncbi:MAG TPA: ABC transporter permease [Stellaceae bacterium]|nr:ABC transporter permease [Stellaceae bacterium]